MNSPSTEKSVLVLTIPNRPPRCYAFEGNHLQIGRSPNNHITIDDQAVSKTHCEFFRDPRFPQWKFRDLGSTNGSELNGHRVEWDAFPLSFGDEIVLGKVIKLLYLSMHEIDIPESLDPEEEDPEVNPVAAAVSRQVRDDMEGTQLIKLPRRKK